MEKQIINDRDLALQYLPHFYADENEPFPIDQIGYAILRAPGPSPSFQRKLPLLGDASFVIEYAVYFDYDIQHMYDLEHVWVYVDKDGAVCNAESSAHGSYWNCFQLHRRLEEETHLPVYLQPGKHAMLPDGELAKLFTNCRSCCDQDAGGGLLEVEMFRGKMPAGKEMDTQIKAHIRENYRFEPTLRYIPWPCAPECVVPMKKLMELIPQRIYSLLERLGIPTGEPV